MMHLFDFKFIVLLGLTLVVYFMYKEIDFQRERLLKCETQIKELLGNTKPLENDDVLQLPPPPASNILPPASNISPPPSFPTKEKVELDNLPLPENNNLKLNLPKKMVTSSSTELESDTTSESSPLETDDKLIQNELTDTKHLEIYSNDNENLTNTSISDTLIKNVEPNDNLEDVLKTLKNEMTLEETNNNLKENTNNLEEKTNNLEKNNLEDLNKLKFTEVQELAKKKNIGLKKKENGKSKFKNKQELIDEINKVY